MLNAKLINNPYNYFLFFSHFRNNNITFYTFCDYYESLRHIAPPLLAQTTKKTTEINRLHKIFQNVCPHSKFWKKLLSKCLLD